jgi:hypothetical protein
LASVAFVARRLGVRRPNANPGLGRAPAFFGWPLGAGASRARILLRIGSMTVQPKFRVAVRARESRGYCYQIFTVGSSEPSIRSDNVIYATREEAEHAGYLAAGLIEPST